MEQDLIKEVQIEGISGHLLIPSHQTAALSQLQPTAEEVRFLAPLDNFLWDRKLIEELFDFHYRWEVYVPEAKRRWGYYVLPILHGSRLIGRIEPERAGKDEFQVKQIWWEEGAPKPGEAFAEELRTFDNYLK